MLDNNLANDRIDIQGRTYTLIKVLGSGRHGNAFLASASPGSEPVCIKKQWHNQMASMEAEITNDVLDNQCASTTKGDFHYIVMPLAVGENLETVRAALTGYEKLLLAKKIKIALKALHKKQYLHQDHKIENVMVNALHEKMPVTLIDYGWATKLADANNPERNLKLSIPFIRMMFQPQTAPEYISGDEIGIHSDIYSFGKLFKSFFPDRTSYISELTNPDPSKRTAAFGKLSIELTNIFEEKKHALLSESLLCRQTISASPLSQHQWQPAELAFTQFEEALRNAIFARPETVRELQRHYHSLTVTLSKMPGNRQTNSSFRNFLNHVRDFIITFIPVGMLLSKPEVIPTEVAMKAWLSSNNARFFTRSKPTTEPREMVQPQPAFTPALFGV